MRPTAHFVVAFYALLSRAKAQDEQCSVITRTIAQITSLEYDFASSNFSHTKQELTTLTNNGFSVSPPGNTAIKSHGIQPDRQISNTETGSQAAPKSQIIQASHPNTRPTITIGSGNRQAGSSSKSGTRLGRIPTKSLPRPSDRSTKNLSTSTPSSGCPASPPGFNLICGQKPGPDSMVETTLRKRATVSSADCVNSCTADGACSGAAYDNEDGSCTLYSTMAPLVPAASYNTFVKISGSESASGITSSRDTQSSMTNSQPLSTGKPAITPSITDVVTQSASGPAGKSMTQQPASNDQTSGPGQTQTISSSSLTFSRAATQASWTNTSVTAGVQSESGESQSLPSQTDMTVQASTAGQSKAGSPTKSNPALSVTAAGVPSDHASPSSRTSQQESVSSSQSGASEHTPSMLSSISEPGTVTFSAYTSMTDFLPTTTSLSLGTGAASSSYASTSGGMAMSESANLVIPTSGASCSMVASSDGSPTPESLVTSLPSSGSRSIISSKAPSASSSTAQTNLSPLSTQSLDFQTSSLSSQPFLSQNSLVPIDSSSLTTSTSFQAQASSSQSCCLASTVAVSSIGSRPDSTTPAITSSFSSPSTMYHQDRTSTSQSLSSLSTSSSEFTAASASSLQSESSTYLLSSSSASSISATDSSIGLTISQQTSTVTSYGSALSSAPLQSLQPSSSATVEHLSTTTWNFPSISSSTSLSSTLPGSISSDFIAASSSATPSFSVASTQSSYLASSGSSSLTSAYTSTSSLHSMTSTGASSPTAPSCYFTGYGPDTTNIGYYTDSATANYYGCNAACSADPSCLSFAINPAMPVCILYPSPVLGYDTYDPASSFTFYDRGGTCPPSPTTTTSSAISATPTPVGKFPYVSHPSVTLTRTDLSFPTPSPVNRIATHHRAASLMNT